MEIIIKYSVILILGIVLNACGSGKNLTKVTDSIEVKIPFSESKYQSDKNYFRAVQSGTSADMSTAKKIALVNAKSELAGNIQTTVRTVTDNYTNQRTFSDKQNFENKFEELSRQVTNQVLTNVVSIDEKILKNKENIYTFWIAIEMNKDEILKNISARIAEDDRLQIDFDKYQFEEVFNQEMEKFILK